jgi:hypothetical protein
LREECWQFRGRRSEIPRKAVDGKKLQGIEYLVKEAKSRMAVLWNNSQLAMRRAAAYFAGEDFEECECDRGGGIREAELKAVNDG